MEKVFYTYILTNQTRRVLYVGITSDLKKRVYQHKEKIVDGFSKKYNVSQLVYYEMHSDAANAIQREKNIKKWNRAWKLELIETLNPEWDDLYYSL